VADTSVGARLRTIGLTVWHFVSSAPLTYSWLVVLALTTLYQTHLHGRQLHIWELHHSTNIHELGTDPLRALFTSLLLLDGNNFEPYPLLFTLFLAPAEHWLRQLRWLTVGLSSHILATYISEGILYYAIEEREAPERLVNASDIGVSYFLVGVMAVLTYHIARPWRWGYLAVLIIIFGFPLITMNHHVLNFTAIGHFAAIFIGLCFYPMTRERTGPDLSPARLKPPRPQTPAPEASA
jgi:hypothetical protein